MQRLEVSGAVRPIYGSLGVKGLIPLKFIAKLSKVLPENFENRTRRNTPKESRSSDISSREDSLTNTPHNEPQVVSIAVVKFRAFSL